MVGLQMKQLRTLVLAFLFSFAFLGFAHANDSVLFEGYYRVLKAGQHVGYYIMKHEFDAKKKQFVGITFMQIEGEEPMTESIKVVASEDFRPITYAYTAMGSGVTRTIDIKTDKTKMTGTIVMKGQTEKVSRVLPKNTISSQFLIYSILRSPRGLKLNTSYDYEAVAEELAEIKKGQAKVAGTETLDGIKAFRIENTFLDTTSNNIVSERGEVLATLSPSQKIAIELVAKPENATGSFRVQNALLKALFGEVPKGEKNPLAQAKTVTPAPGAPKKDGP